MEKKIVNKEALVRKIYASETMQNYTIKNNKLTLDLIRTIYDELGNQITNSLSEITEENDKDNPIVVRVFDGMSLSGYYKPPIDKVPSFFKNNPDKCNLSDFKSKVGIKTNITRYFKKKISKLNNEYLDSLD